VRRVVLARLHAVPLVDESHLVSFVAAELHADQLGVVVHLSAQSADLAFEVLTHFLLVHQPLRVVTDLARVEGGGDGTALGQVVDGGGGDCHGLWVDVAIGAAFDPGEDIAVVVEHLVWPQDVLFLLGEALGKSRLW